MKRLGDKKRQSSGSAETVYDAPSPFSPSGCAGLTADEPIRLWGPVAQVMPFGLVMTDALRPDNPVVHVNPAFTRLTGYPSEEVLEKSLLFLQGADTDPGAVAEVRAAIRNERACTVELLNYRKDGRPFWNELTVIPVRNEAGRLTHWAGVQNDVTARRQLEEFLCRSQKTEAMVRFAGMVAHDLNNLHSVIVGYTDLALLRFAPGTPPSEDLEKVLEAGCKAGALTHELLTFSRKQLPGRGVLDLGTFVIDMETILCRLVGPDIEVVILPPSETGLVRAERDQLEQVVLNLALNARDAMPRGGRLTMAVQNVTLDPSRAQVPAEIAPGPYVLLTVSDTGCGMADEVKAHLFEPFFTTKETGKGTGLGLAIVHEVVREGRGHIAMDSEPGQGTTFQIYLPRLGEKQVSLQERPVLDACTGGTETVLLVEDDPSLAVLVREALRRSGYTVFSVTDGAAAQRLAERHTGPIHLLVVEGVLRGMSGASLVQRIRANHPEARVLYLSGCQMEEATVLRKPFTATNLIRKVRKVLDG